MVCVYKTKHNKKPHPLFCLFKMTLDRHLQIICVANIHTKKVSIKIRSLN